MLLSGEFRADENVLIVIHLFIYGSMTYKHTNNIINKIIFNVHKKYSIICYSYILLLTVG